MFSSDIDISMPGYVTRYVKRKETVFYQIELEYKKRAWILEKRFNDFSDLNKILKEKLGNMPPLPPKTFLKLKKEEFLTNRKCKLEIWLITLLSRKDVFAVREFLDFLEVTILVIFFRLTKMLRAWV